jgi:anti-sigma factor RsiW
MSPSPLNCDELVQLVTDYLEHALGDAEQRRFEKHLAECEGCRAYVDQIRVTIRLTGRLAADDLPREARDELVAAFRGWRVQPDA